MNRKSLFLVFALCGCATLHAQEAQRWNVGD